MSDLNKQSASLTPETLPDRETILRRWDTWQKRIAADKDVSWARHEFELLLDGYEEEIGKFKGICDDQFAEIHKLRAELDEAGEIIDGFASNCGPDDQDSVMTEIIVPTFVVKDARAFLSKHQRAE